MKRTPSTWTLALMTGLMFIIGMAAAASLAASRQQPVNPDAQTLVDFTKRVKAYTDLRNKIDSGLPPNKQTNDPAQIVATQRALAARIRTARSAAVQGEIFAPEIEKKFRALLRPEVKGPDGAKTKAAIADEKPAVALKVNGDYPSAEPLTTMPPNILQALPKLPDGLEFRFVRTHMILLDTRANLIVDFLLNAIP